MEACSSCLLYTVGPVKPTVGLGPGEPRLDLAHFLKPILWQLLLGWIKTLIPFLHHRVLLICVSIDALFAYKHVFSHLNN